MPVIDLHVKQHLLPTAEQLADRDNLPDAMKALERFKSELREITLLAVNGVDGSHLGLDQVVLNVVAVHPWSENVADVWYLIEPDDRDDLDPRMRRNRRIAIRNLAREGVDAYFASHPGDRPFIDVECRPISGAGFSLDDGGRELGRWPDSYANA